jgi:hypothetical protein
MVRRRVGAEGTRALAGSVSATAAVDALVGSPYDPNVRAGDTVEDATDGILATVLWNLRVLVGWLPLDGVEMLRRLAGWFEISNMEQHLRMLSGRQARSPFSLGALSVAWPRMARTLSVDELRSELAASPWGAVGGTPRELQLSLRLAWAERVAARVPLARAWALGAVALLLARERFGRQLPLPDGCLPAARRLLGGAADGVSTLADLGAAVPQDARWALQDLDEPDDLWLGEARWWRRLHDDSVRLVARAGFGPETAVGAAGLLAEDAWRAIAALSIAGRGDESLAVFDAMA